jgi:hypothetical protein
MNIYKLKYENKEQGISDLESKGILTENGYGYGVEAVVEIGLILLEYTEEQPIFADGYFFDVMSVENYNFGDNLVVPKNPKHAFAGHDVIKEVNDVIIDLA